MLLSVLKNVRKRFLEASTFCFDFYHTLLISSNQTQGEAVKASGREKLHLSGSVVLGGGGC